MAEAEKSCLTCPSYLDSVQAEKFFGRATGKPMCASLGKILSVENGSESEKMIASGCDRYGQSAPTDNPFRGRLLPDTVIMTPDPELLSLAVAAPQKVRSCLMCVNYVKPETMNESYGITSGGCAVKGRVILDRLAAAEAAACGMSRQSTGEFATLDNIHLIPMYKEVTVDPIAAHIASGGEIIEPKDHPTDRPVSDEDRADGIIAWRKIVDQKNHSRFTFLPVFDIEFFDEFEQAKIPQTGSVEHPEWYIDMENLVYTMAVSWVQLDETPVLWGQPGVGKTELLRHIAWLMQVPFDRISITESSEVEDVIGKMMFLDGETKYQYGRIPLRWGKPGVLLLDEPNTAPDALWQRIRPLTDNSKQLVLDEANGESIERHLFTYFAMAMNPAWDPGNTGVKVLAKADRSRLTHVYVPLPKPDVERSIILRRLDDDDVEMDEVTLDKVMAVAADIRSMCDEGTVDISWGIRDNIKAARMLAWFDPITAYRRAVADDLDPQTGEMILSAVRAHMGA